MLFPLGSLLVGLLFPGNLDLERVVAELLRVELGEEIVDGGGRRRRPQRGGRVVLADASGRLRQAQPRRLREQLVDELAGERVELGGRRRSAGRQADVHDARARPGEEDEAPVDEEIGSAIDRLERIDGLVDVERYVIAPQREPETRLRGFRRTVLLTGRHRPSFLSAADLSFPVWDTPQLTGKRRM